MLLKTLAMVLGYQAVICGMDPVCRESGSWMEIAQVDKLFRGPNQPFYQVKLLRLSFPYCELLFPIINFFFLIELKKKKESY